MIATIVITAIIVAYVVWVIFRQIKRKKAGGCSCGCDGCEKSDKC
jgi:hypothetical protein